MWVWGLTCSGKVWSMGGGSTVCVCLRVLARSVESGLHWPWWRRACVECHGRLRVSVVSLVFTRLAAERRGDVYQRRKQRYYVWRINDCQLVCKSGASKCD